MSDHHKALADIGRIREQMAARTMLRSFGPTVIAVSGLLAVAAAIGQSGSVLPAEPPLSFLFT